MGNLPGVGWVNVSTMACHIQERPNSLTILVLSISLALAGASYAQGVESASGEDAAQFTIAPHTNQGCAYSSALPEVVVCDLDARIEIEVSGRSLRIRRPGEDNSVRVFEGRLEPIPLDEIQPLIIDLASIYVPCDARHICPLQGPPIDEPRQVRFAYTAEIWEPADNDTGLGALLSGAYGGALRPHRTADAYVLETTSHTMLLWSEPTFGGFTSQFSSIYIHILP